MKPLKLPPTIRTTRPDEIPSSPDLLERIKERDVANIVEGFTILSNLTDESAFQFYAEINIDNERLWDLLRALVVLMPDFVSFIYGHIDKDLSFSAYLDKYELLNKLEDFKSALTQDGFLEFGVICQDDASLNEIFVKKAKYVQYWFWEDQPFRALMDRFGISETADLNFIDEFPMTTEALFLHDPDAMETEDLLASLKMIFGQGQ